MVNFRLALEVVICSGVLKTGISILFHIAFFRPSTLLLLDSDYCHLFDPQYKSHIYLLLLLSSPQSFLFICGFHLI